MRDFAQDLGATCLGAAATAGFALTPGLEEVAPYAAVGTGGYAYATAEDVTQLEQDAYNYFNN